MNHLQFICKDIFLLFSFIKGHSTFILFVQLYDTYSLESQWIWILSTKSSGVYSISLIEMINWL